MRDEDQFLFSDDWYAQIPNVHRWLGGDSSQPFPRVYPHDKFQVDFWFAPFYLMKAILGWKDIAAGVAHLFDAQSTLEGPAQMLDSVWGKELLGSLAWWAWSNSGYVGRGQPSLVFREHGLPEKYEPVALQNGFGGGGDPIHLVDHIQICTGHYQGGERVEDVDESPPANFEFIKTDSPRRVVMIVDRFEQWPPELGRLSNNLPNDPPSWHVHVVVRSMGYIGCFRRCWDCGRWFQGKAIHHKWGHVDGHPPSSPDP